ncbi:type II toxin-antitoxin system death-on-curing family toxin [Actinokineospora sp. PR83]|uniref:type II toxin-antitoxin system death-on-curing family toxin n=1 Tax=Actinokineospora sp. PR83 TaxID=2884908 RepID=UPI001F00C2AA|nr:type II toxin-antitoxin system death-on-curing family toxin [Actinokineospora sp. PR83]MCG8919259.1 type II toxin-antitoxin system death-on-curing family toxin [Actinokineospora sp. PR83]
MATQDSGWNYPEADDVLAIMVAFDLVLDLRDRGALEAACASPRVSVGGVDVHTDVSAKAAALAWSLCKLHPFVDGNKRCTAIMLPYFCLTNGWDPKITPGELVAVTLEMARGQMHRDELAAWLRRRCEGGPS